MYRYLCVLKFSFLWHKCPRMQLLNYMVHAWIVSLETERYFSRVTVPFYISISKYVFQFLLSSTFLVLSLYIFSHFGILIGMLKSDQVSLAVIVYI